MKPIHLPFVASIFVSATLLFLVQPLVTRLLLPGFGGTPAVWNTALVFFQTVLLLGYLYAHGLVRIRSEKVAMAAHGLVLLLPLVLLSQLQAQPATPAPGAWPGFTLLVMLTIMVGAPFFVLSTNSSLVQHWWSRSGYRGTDDPYWLYGASNLGSLLALVAYPVVMERVFPLNTQTRLWSLGYGLFILLTVAAMALSRRGRVSETFRSGGELGSSEGVRDLAGAPAEDGDSLLRPIGVGRIVQWVIRAAVGSSLLLSLTMNITTDVASVPLFWVVPLAIYLITFILAFSFTSRIPRRPVEVGTVICVCLSLGLLFQAPTIPFGFSVAVGLFTLFFGALLCHRDLAADRPAAKHLTGFYLWISVGGASGGILNSLVAPIVFDSVAEFPLTLLAVAALLYVPPGKRPGPFNFKLSLIVAALAIGGLLGPLAIQFGGLSYGKSVALAGFLALLAYAVFRLPGVFLATVLAATALGILAGSRGPGILAQERSFFGVVRVWEDENVVTMNHGTTIHGQESRDPALKRVPRMYHHPSGPLGSVVVDQPPGAKIGVLGLGAGALAALIDPGQEMVFHEIDPMVVDMAYEHFSFVPESLGEIEMVLGDGRLTLADIPPKSYDLLVADAFSSDAVPIHLLTVEALELYLSSVKPHGLVLLHVSNRHVKLLRVMKGYAAATGAVVAFADHSPSGPARAEGANRTLVAAISPDPDTIEELLQSLVWERLDPEGKSVVWTDSRSDILSVLF